MKVNNLFKFLLILAIFCLSCASRKLATTPTWEIKDQKTSGNMNDKFISDLLSSYPLLFDSILKNNKKWQVQIIYTQIDRNEKNEPRFTHHYFNIQPYRYFYPASTVKLPTAVLSLQKLNELNIPGLDRNTTMITDSAFTEETSVYNDPNSGDGRPTIANYIKKIFLVSDNEAYNRLYEFLGQEYLNKSLQKMGYDSVQIIHRLNISLTEDENRHTNPVTFYDTSHQILYQQPIGYSQLDHQKRFDFLGKGFYSDGKLTMKPFDFSKKNRLTLADLHSIMESVLFPEVIPKKSRFNLKEDDYRFLYRYMSMKPVESKFPQYDTSYSEAYSKLLLYGGKGKMDDSIRVFNKEGDAYGFLTDVAYIVDFKNHVEFMLSASILCNSDGIFNDDYYDYDHVGYPFLKNLGRVFYQYELGRKRKFNPDLSKFKLDYRE